jgi:hypothetical protein
MTGFEGAGFDDHTFRLADHPDTTERKREMAPPIPGVRTSRGVFTRGTDKAGSYLQRPRGRRVSSLRIASELVEKEVQERIGLPIFGWGRNRSIEMN